MKPFVAAEYFLSMYSNSVLTKRMMAMMRLPKATVPRWYVVAVQREAPRIAKLPGSFFDLLQYLIGRSSVILIQYKTAIARMVKLMYRVFFLTGPPPKSSKYGTGPPNRIK